MVIPLVDDPPKDIQNMPIVIETDLWLKLGLQRLEPNAGSTPTGFKRREFGELITQIETEAQSECESWVDNYCAYYETPANLMALIHDNDAAVIGGVAASTVAVSGGVVIGGGIVINSNDVFSGGLTIRGQMHTAHFYILPAAGEPRDLAREEQLSWDRCKQVLFAFASYAKEILELKGITITETRIRNWQAIEDTNWKQCILDITVNTEPHIALRVWDELSAELQKFINTQPEVFRSFLEDKLSLNVKWG
ncbi:hypothetical protein ACFLUU_10290 [Chloroflexota bacterium]